jgi:hypothetical protein
MKRNNQKRRVVDNTPRHTRSDHGANNLYTPPIKKLGLNAVVGDGASPEGDSALLKRLEKITNEINTMQTYPNQNQPPNQNYHTQGNQYSQMGGGPPGGFPPSLSNASPRPMDFYVGQDFSPRQMNEMSSNHSHQNPENLSPHKMRYGSQQYGTGTGMSVSNQMVSD